MTDTPSVLQQLMTVIRQRRDHPRVDSYTCQLLAGGVTRITSKISEEAAEVVEAAGEPAEEGSGHLIREASDLVYHLLVLLAARDADWKDVETELASRFGISGLAEKAARKGAPDP